MATLSVTLVRGERYQSGWGLSKAQLLVFELGREVGHATVQAGQLPVVGFRHFDAVPLPQLHHDVQEVHRVQFELVSMDFLDIVMELRKRYSVEVPEADYGQLASLDSCVTYLAPKLKDK